MVWLPIMYSNVPDSDTMSCTVSESNSKWVTAGGIDKAHESGCTPCNEGTDSIYSVEPMTSEVHEVRAD